MRVITKNKKIARYTLTSITLLFLSLFTFHILISQIIDNITMLLRGYPAFICYK